MQTTSSSVSITSERMALLLEHIAEDPDAPLLTHTQNMLVEIGITDDEGNVVCSTFPLYPLHITVSLYFYLSLAILYFTFDSQYYAFSTRHVEDNA